MNNGGMLSQEEIDALLGNDNESGRGQPEDIGENMIDHFTEIEKDVLGEIGNISFGSAATALSTILNQKVEITTPTVDLVSKSHLEQEFTVPYVSILVEYTEGFQGSNVLIVKTSDASVIAHLMMGGDGLNPSNVIGEMELSAVQEAMNQMMGSSATSMSTIFDRKIDISPPAIELMDVKEDVGTENLPADEMMFKVSFRLKIGNLVDSSIMQIIPIHFAKTLVDLLLNKSDKVSPVTFETPSGSFTQQAQDMKEKGPDRGKLEKKQAVPDETAKHSKASHSNVQAVEFSDFNDQPVLQGKSQNIELLMDIPLQVNVELGSTKKTVKEVLELSPGAIIELDKLAGEPVDILINQKNVAKGEVVVIDENFGVRITEILNQHDRLCKL
ncbi:flagellar motor switch protein FliN/FliY [Scopulibacillus darangshiensis]|uniref:Flagellar motor switch protein FliN/FliY n=1 Tax=Scopulibacillus darangshiensis TaxID=442528 RepID=A0A4R2P619_9BACL|nr:flagellar motor switch phosphatase FliY [Scopulibacillus darangshiensis]TCP30320.1 flagellar motor switch protein FliN/FliY [Scopulibacillus darangshiensis]